MKPIITTEEYTQRRRRLLDAMGHSIAIIKNDPERVRNGDGHYPYRSNSSFYYLTGFSEPEAILVLIRRLDSRLRGNDVGESILFVRPRCPAEEQWTGLRAGTEGAVQDYQVDQAFPLDEFDTRLPELLSNQTRLMYQFGRDPQWDARILNALNAARRFIRQGKHVPDQILSIDTLLDEMRLIKSPSEIQMMRYIADHSAKAHVRAMKHCRPALNEYHLAAEIHHELALEGSHETAYPSIVGSGANACILHYTDNKAILRDGDLVLIDAGGEYGNYSADITRTFPINGTFNPQQKALYNLVLKAQMAAIELIKPGLIWSAIQETIVKVFTKGLIELGILNGKFDDLIHKQAYLPFYMHSSGHWLGLDTHDVGSYRKADGQWRPLEAGMVLTVEPGLYISPDAENIDPIWKGIAIRIEDDILVTSSGHEVLSQAAPKTVKEIEALMQG